jgi:hypothetical protein
MITRPRRHGASADSDAQSVPRALKAGPGCGTQWLPVVAVTVFKFPANLNGK